MPSALKLQFGNCNEIVMNGGLICITPERSMDASEANFGPTSKTLFPVRPALEKNI